MTRVAVSGNVPTTQKRAVVSLAASGIVVAAVAAKVLKCYAYSYQSRNDGMTVQLTNGLGGAALDQVWTFNAREGAVAPLGVPDSYYFATTAGVAIYAVLTGVGTVDIAVSYWDNDVS